MSAAGFEPRSCGSATLPVPHGQSSGGEGGPPQGADRARAQGCGGRRAAQAPPARGRRPARPRGDRGRRGGDPGRQRWRRRRAGGRGAGRRLGRGAAARAADDRHGRRREGRRLHADEPRLRGRQPRAEGLHGLGLQDEPADLRQPLPRLVRRRRLRAGHDAEPRHARPHARARADRRPVQEGHAEGRRRQARGAARRAERRLPHAAVTRTRPACSRRSRRRPGRTR